MSDSSDGALLGNTSDSDFIDCHEDSLDPDQDDTHVPLLVVPPALWHARPPAQAGVPPCCRCGRPRARPSPPSPLLAGCCVCCTSTATGTFLWKLSVCAWWLFVVFLAFHLLYLFAVDVPYVVHHCASTHDTHVARLVKRLAPALDVRGHFTPPAVLPDSVNGTYVDTRMHVLRAYSPVVLLDDRESFWPMSTAAFAAGSRLEAAHVPDLPRGHVTGEAVNRTQRAFRRWAARHHQHYPDTLPLLMVPEDSIIRGFVPERVPSVMTEAPMGANIRLICPVGYRQPSEELRQRGKCDRFQAGRAQPYWEVRYLFFYGNNGEFLLLGLFTVGGHVGDLEHAIVRIDAASGRVLRVFYAQHEVTEGRWHHPSALDWANGSHPIVFSALHSHASYPTCGVHQRRGWRFFLPHDHTNGLGGIWIPAAIQPVVFDPAFAQYVGDQDLLRDFEGCWGSWHVFGLQRQAWWEAEPDP